MKITSILKKLLNALKIPETQDQDLDSVATTLHHASIIRKKIFLRKLYIDFYSFLTSNLPVRPADGKVIELGSGGGFLKEINPSIITSDIQELPGIDLVFSATKMPFKDASVDAVIGLNILHHISDISSFLKELERCLNTKGKAIFIEPANTLWGRFIYQHFHHENFDPQGSWTFEDSGPLSGANGALPWIVFCRDRKRFEKEFPGLKITQFTNHTPLRYLLSGGVSMKQLVPSVSYPFIHFIEKIMSPFNNITGMFVSIQIERR